VFQKQPHDMDFSYPQKMHFSSRPLIKEVIWTVKFASHHAQIFKNKSFVPIKTG
jgi:hypothetical protein